jgi:metal-sulfur cluster biosynthetic enzyme
MPITEETVYEALRQVCDPELPVNIVDLGLIYGIGVDDSGGKTDLLVVMTMTTPACPYGPELLRDVKSALAALAGVGEVEVKLTLTPPWTPDRMTDDALDQLGLF